MISTKKKKIEWIDLLRAGATLAAISIHCISIYYIKFDKNQILNWLVTDSIDSMMRWAVPVFVMVSGSLLLSTPQVETIGTFLKKRFKKLMVPFLFWSFCYGILNVLVLGTSLNLTSILKIFIGIFSKPTFYHLYFFYILFSLYLLTPILRSYVRIAKHKDYCYILILWLTFSVFFNFLTKFGLVNVGFVAPLICGYIGYFLLGYYLTRWPVAESNKVLVFGFIASVLITLLGNLFITMKSGNVSEIMFNHLFPNIVIMTSVIFIAAQRIPVWKKNSLVTQISNTSLGMYLIHPLILSAITRLIPIENMTLGFPFYFIFVSVSTFFFVSILHKIPVVRKLV